MQIKVKTEMTKEVFMKLQQYYIFRVLKSLFMFLFFMLLIFVLASGVLRAASVTPNYLQGLLAALIFPAIMWVFTRLFPAYKNKKAVGNINEFTFGEDILIRSSSPQGYSGETQLAYSALDKITETREFIYLWFSQNQVFIVDKRGISPEDITQLHALLKQHIPAEKCRLQA